MAGYIRQIFVDVGDKVKAGQVLAVLEVPELSAQVAGARRRLSATRMRSDARRAKSQRAQSAHAAAHSAYTRLKQASESRPGLIAEQELDDSMAKDKETEAQVESAKPRWRRPKANSRFHKANTNSLSALEAYSHITAPFAGVVTKRYADTGALIQAGTASDTQAMPVVQLAEWSRLRLVVPVPESDASLQFAWDQRCKCMSPPSAGTFKEGGAFCRCARPETRTMHTEIDVENRDGTLKDGMYAEAI